LLKLARFICTRPVALPEISIAFAKMQVTVRLCEAYKQQYHSELKQLKAEGSEKVRTLQSFMLHGNFVRECHWY
jgi:hypothetical protein